MDSSDISRVKELVSVSHVAGQYVKLKRCGSSPDQFIGLCPFHQEKTPSFRVDDKRGSYKCFGCGASGDVISLTEQLEGVNFKEALSRLKIDAGIESEFLTKSQKRAVEAERAKHASALSNLRKWRQKLRSDLIGYTNAQWRMYRIARRQAMVAGSEELDEQIENHFREAIRRESALDELDSMRDQELMEWYQTYKSWEGVKNPPWVLTGWRLQIAREAVA